VLTTDVFGNATHSPSGTIRRRPPTLSRNAAGASTRPQLLRLAIVGGKRWGYPTVRICDPAYQVPQQGTFAL
jgi:hypothetical protein